MKNKRKLLIPLLVFLLGILTFWYAVVHYNSLFVFSGDNFEQEYLFILGGINRLQNWSFSAYDWSAGFGADFLIYTFFSSPLSLLLSFIQTSYLKYSILYLQILKITITFCFAWLWLSKISKRQITRWIGALLFAFSGWVFRYYNFTHFLDGYMFYPLILFFVERYFQDKKTLGLIISIAALGIVNYYFLYMAIPLLFIYTLIRYFDIYRNRIKFKTMLLDAFQYILWLALGIGLSAFILIPCGLLFIKIERFSVTEGISILSHINFNDVYRIFSSIYSPVFNFFSYNPFISTWQSGDLGWNGGGTLYLYMITPLLLPLIFSLKDKQRKKILLIVFFLMIPLIYFKSFYFLLQRTVDTRWFFIITIIMIYADVIILDEILENKITRKEIAVSLFFNAVSILFIFCYSYFGGFNELDTIKHLFIKLFPCYLFMFIEALLLIKHKYMKSLLPLVLCFEIIYSGTIYCANNIPLDLDFFEEEGNLQTVLNNIKEKDNGFYRIQLDITTMPEYYKQANIPFAYNYAGTSIYNSTYEGEMSEYYKRINNGLWMFNQLTGRQEMYNQLSSKYFISFGDSKVVPVNYEKVFSTNEGFIVYENKDFIDLGYSGEVINIKDFEKLPYLYQDMLMQQIIYSSEVAENSGLQWDQDLIHLGTMPNQEYRELYLDQELDDGILYVDNRGIPELNIKLYHDEEIVQDIIIDQFDYIDLNIKEEDKINRIVILGEDVYNTNLYMDVYYKPLDKITKKDKIFNNTVINGFNVQSQLVLDQDSFVATSIPYNQGWSVYLDNKKIDVEKVNLGFIGFYANEGNHVVEFKYKTQGKFIGTMISLFSLSVLIIVCIKTRKREKLK